MSVIPEDLRYTEAHVWVKVLDKNLLQVGITDFAQAELGDLVYVELPKVGQELQSGEQCATVESVKTASDIFSPLNGIVHAINQDVIDDPALINDTPYQQGLFTLQTDATVQLDTLLDANQYQQFIEA